MMNQFTFVVVLLISASIVEIRSMSFKHSLPRTRRTVTGLRTSCIPYLKKFCQWFTVRGVPKQFCVVRTAYICTALDQN